MAAIWYYLKGGERQGPITAPDLKRCAADGLLMPEDLVWKEGMAVWEPARSVKGLFEEYRVPDEKGAAPFAPPVPAYDSQANVAGLPLEEKIKSPRSLFSSAGLAALALVLALLAVVLSALALLRAPARPEAQTAGKGLAAYDLSTPEAAASALWQMRHNNDFAAAEEYRELAQGDAKEALDSLKTVDTLDCKEMKIVLFSYTRGGKEKHDFAAFFKHPAKNLWVERRLDALDLEPSHPEIARRLKDWRTRATDPLTLD
jgi:hypothetical protein